MPTLDSAESNPVSPLFCNFLLVSFFRDAPDLDELVSLSPGSGKFTCYTERKNTKREVCKAVLVLVRRGSGPSEFFT